MSPKKSLKKKTTKKFNKYIVMINDLINANKKSFFIGLSVLLIFFISLVSFIIKNNSFLVKNRIQQKDQEKKIEKKFPTIYITKKGDYLWQIAEKFYGSGYNAYQIAQANKLSDPNNIPPGTKLVLPSLIPLTPTKGEITPIAAQTEKVEYEKDDYVVQIGDSLSLIALKVYGDLEAWPIIAQANNISQPDQIEIGMRLKIPKKIIKP